MVGTLCSAIYSTSTTGSNAALPARPHAHRRRAAVRPVNDELQRAEDELPTKGTGRTASRRGSGGREAQRPRGGVLASPERFTQAPPQQQRACHPPRPFFGARGPETRRAPPAAAPFVDDALPWLRRLARTRATAWQRATRAGAWWQLLKASKLLCLWLRRGRRPSGCSLEGISGVFACDASRVN